MTHTTCFFDDETPTMFTPSRFAGTRLLIAGVGGGADCVTAWALGKWLKASATPPASVIIANSKKPQYLPTPEHRAEGRHIFDAVPDNPNFYLDTRLPEHEPCVIIRSPGPDAPIIDGLDKLDFDTILAVDTGADIVTRTGRDWCTYQALLASGRAAVLALVSPGADGQEKAETLREGARGFIEDHTLLGHQPTRVLAPLLESVMQLLEAYCIERKPEGEKSTLQIAADAFDEAPTAEIKVPREKRPAIPARWLQGTWFLEHRRG